jgi:hypothetical protein
MKCAAEGTYLPAYDCFKEAGLGLFYVGFLNKPSSTPRVDETGLQNGSTLALKAGRLEPHARRRRL